MREQDDVKVAVSVKNVGERAGSEVIQIYGMEARPRNKRPVKELFGFQKVALGPGEEKTVEVVIEKDALRTFDAKRREWLIPIGEYHLYVEPRHICGGNAACKGKESVSNQRGQHHGRNLEKFPRGGSDQPVYRGNA